MTPNGSEQATMREAILLWGETSQMLMAVEECAELQQSLLHVLRGRHAWRDVARELADVEIMCAQLRLMMPPSVDVDEEVARKMERLRFRVSSAKGLST